MTTVCGGYFVVGGAPCPDYANAGLLPDTLWTPTSCICGLYPSTVTPQPRSSLDDELAALGLPFDRAEGFLEWVREQRRSGHLGEDAVFLDLSTTREFVARFLLRRECVKLLAIELASPYVEEFLADTSEFDDKAIVRAIKFGLAPEAGGTCLGYEPLGYDGYGLHSFICNSLESAYVEELGLSLNPHGRIAEFEAAVQAIDYTRLESTGAEPALWCPWRVVEYSLTPTVA